MPYDEGNVYRIKIHPTTNEVSVIHIGMDCLDPLPDGDYSWDELPEWMRGKLAALYTMHVPPPPVSVDSVGQRISERVFWVYG